MFVQNKCCHDKIYYSELIIYYFTQNFIYEACNSGRSTSLVVWPRVCLFDYILQYVSMSIRLLQIVVKFRIFLFHGIFVSRCFVIINCLLTFRYRTAIRIIRCINISINFFKTIICCFVYILNRLNVCFNVSYFDSILTGKRQNYSVHKSKTYQSEYYSIR